MKLRAKLITSFGTLLLVVILVFTAITYGTFAEFLTREGKEVLQLKAQAFLLQFNGVMDQEYARFRRARRNWHGRGPGTISGKEGELAARGIFRNVSVLAGASARRAEFPAQPAAKTAARPQDLDLRLVQLPEGIFLVGPLVGKAGRSEGLLAARLDLARLRRFLLAQARVAKALIALSLHGHLLTACSPPGGPSLEGAQVAALLRPSWEKTGQALSLGRYLVLTSMATREGVQISYILPRGVSHRELAKLKDRLFVAILLLGYLAVWLVLVIAYRISRPISDLCQASKDIISFNYETPVKLLSGQDEIGALGESFETMRRKIKELVSQDSLTRTYNRRHLMEVLGKEVAKALRLGEELSCLMIDIDHFKRINDRYGHRCGDEVLERLGRLLMAEVRSYDTLARYGGEEFTLLLPNTGTETAWHIAERLRQRVAAFAFSWQGETIRCTLSLGVSTLAGGRPADPESLIDQADQALYAAKDAGRNRTVLFRAADLDREG